MRGKTIDIIMDVRETNPLSEDMNGDTLCTLGQGRRVLVFLLSLFIPLFLVSCVVNVPLPSGRAKLEEYVVMGKGVDKIVVMNISGVISWDERRDGLIWRAEPSIVARIKEELDKAKGDDSVKALVLKVDSPGGLISASETIYREIKKFKDERKIPIVSYISSIGASGAYYVITPSDKIVASPGSAVGSIGVYMMKLNVERLSEKVGVEFEVIKAGEHKDSLLFHRGLTDEERKSLQQKINYYYESFKKVVADGRGNRLKKNIDEIANGSIFTPEEALEIGLVDEVGDIYFAIEEAARLARIKDYKVVMYARENRRINSVWDETYSRRDLGAFLKTLVDHGIYIVYIYPGGI